VKWCLLIIVTITMMVRIVLSDNTIVLIYVLATGSEKRCIEMNYVFCYLSFVFCSIAVFLSK
jgi:hypothetical protein